jgi:hypothetical protein
MPDLRTVADLRKIPSSLRGLDAENPVNRTRIPGVQLELPPGARGTNDPRAPRGAPAVPDARLVDVLARSLHELSRRVA